MKLHSAVRPKSYLPGLVLALALMCTACGGTNSEKTISNQPPPPTPPPPPPPPPPATTIMQGTWELVFQSEVSPTVFKVFEANLSQAGTHVFAGTAGSLVFQAPGAYPTRLLRLGGICDGGTVSSVTVDGTLSNQQPASATVSFTFTETGDLGSVVTSASASTNGVNIPSGNYSVPAACGFPADHGTFFGYRDSVAFRGEVFSGTINSGADVIVASFTSTENTFSLAVSGTDNGAKFTLTGSTVGFSLDLTGNVGGKAVNWFALFDPTYFTFTIYDANGQLVGNLHGGAIP